MIFGFLTSKNLTQTKFQDERMTRTIFITWIQNGRFYPGTPNLVKFSNLNNFGTIRSKGWNFRGFIISLLSTNSEKINKIWEVKVSTSKNIGSFDMELPMTKFDKRNTQTSKTFDNGVMSKNFDVTDFFLIYGKFAAILELNSRRMVYKTYIFINSNLLPYRSWKQNWKISNTALILLFWVKVLFLQKKCWFLPKKKPTKMMTEVSSIILICFRQGVILHPKMKP